MTKDADKLLCCVYKTYLERRNSCMSKEDSRYFENDFYKSDSHLSSWSYDDIDDTLNELKRIGYVKKSVTGSFELLDESVEYMENRFKNGLTEVLDIISKIF